LFCQSNKDIARKAGKERGGALVAAPPNKKNNEKVEINEIEKRIFTLYFSLFRPLFPLIGGGLAQVGVKQYLQVRCAYSPTCAKPPAHFPPFSVPFFLFCRPLFC